MTSKDRKYFRVTFEVEATSEEAVKELFNDVVELPGTMILSEEYLDTAEENLVRIGYDKLTDSFNLLISNDGGDTFDFSEGSRCVRAAGQSKEAEPMFVSCELINALKKAIAYGYRVVY
ncbi:MAG: hypothetical protein J6V49_02825 [Bacteroidales bacterium]|nr:hypothetical protein [Bacteroidales bacterium]